RGVLASPSVEAPVGGSHLAFLLTIWRTDHEERPDVAEPDVVEGHAEVLRSEERRVGKEWSSRWSGNQVKRSRSRSALGSVAVEFAIRSISFFFASRRRHSRFSRDWSSDVCSSDLKGRTCVPKR